MVDNIEALQPDPDDMEWAASAGTVVYVPHTLTVHPELVGPNCGFYPSPTRPRLPHEGLDTQASCKVCPQSSGALQPVDPTSSAAASVQTDRNTRGELRAVDFDEETAAAPLEEGIHVADLERTVTNRTS